MQMMPRTAIHPLKIVAALGAAFVLWGLVLAYASSPAWAATFTVDRNDDPDLSTTPTADDCTAAANDCSLRGAIDAANSSNGEDNIVFDLGQSATITIASGTLPEITAAGGALTINGGSADITVSGNDQVRLFFVASDAQLSLNELTLTKGFTNFNNGGALFNLGTLEVNNSTFSGNSSNQGFGGAIANTSSATATVSNSTFSGNSTFFRDGGAILNEGTLDVSDSTFSNGSAPFGGGSAIYNSVNLFTANPTAEVSDSTFSNNSAHFAGGAIRNEGTIDVSDSTFSGNTSSHEKGGAIANDSSGTATVSDSTFSGNSALMGAAISNQRTLGLKVSNSTFSGNSAFGSDTGQGGGGIWNNGSTTVTNSTFSGNSAAAGGGIFNDNGAVALKNTIVANSTSGGDCGGRPGKTITDGGYNLSSDDTCGFSDANNSQHGTVEDPLDPKLGGLADNGGPTETHALLAGSPAIDKGNNAFALDTEDNPLEFDQRGEGFPRIVGCAVDIGAYELALDEDTNCPPTAEPDSYSTNEDIALNVAAAQGVLANDSDADGDTLKAVLVDNVAHGSLTLHDDGSFDYNPAPNFNGQDSFTYKAKDPSGAESDTVTVTLNVTPVNDKPVATNDTRSTPEDTALTVPAPGVLGNDSDVDGDPLTAVKVSGPSHGTLTLNADGSFTYTPATNYNGPDSFTYKANDGSADSSVATVSITVTAVNDAPVAQGDSYSTDEDIALNVAAPGVLGNDSDVDGDSLSAVLVSGPAHGTLTLNANGSFSYTPANNYNGPDSFTYTVSDGKGGTDTATVTIKVSAVNDAPTANAQSVSTNEDTNKVITLAGNDIEGDTLSYKITSLPTNGKLRQGTTEITSADLPFSLSSNQLTYDPNDNYNNTAATADAFDFKVNDGTVDSAAAAKVNVTVTPVNDAPTVAVAAGGASCGTNDRSGTINLTVNDPDGQQQTESLMLGATSNNTTLVPNTNSNLTFGGSGAARTLRATALSGRTGTALITVTVSDGTATGTTSLTLKAGGNSNDTLLGTSATDILLGQNGDDTLRGMGGNDLMCGARGNDRLTGGLGADRFEGGSGNDRAADFTTSEGDTKDNTVETF